VFWDYGSRNVTVPATPTPTPLGQLLQHRLSTERLKPYFYAAGQDLERAAQLYQWNSEVASALGVLTGHLEVIVRNALHDQLTVWHQANGRSGHWYDDPAQVLADKRREDIAKARERLMRSRKHETPGRIVAELMFGFWRLLLDARYQNTLWAPALRHAFPHLQPQRRVDIYQRVDRIYSLRNRTHHEPIHHLDLATLHDDELLPAAACIDPEIESWLRRISRVPALLAAKP